MPEELPETPYEQAKTLEHVLLVACEGKRDDAWLYQQLRGLLIGDPGLKSSLPEFVRTCRDLEHFWQYIKTTSGQWAPRRLHVRDKLTPLFEHLEGTKTSPVDADVSNVLASFDAVGTHAIWTKAVARRIPDPEGATTCPLIVSARMAHIKSCVCLRWSVYCRIARPFSFPRYSARAPASSRGARCQIACLSGHLQDGNSWAVRPASDTLRSG